MFTAAYCLIFGSFVYILLLVMVESRIPPWSKKGMVLVYLIVLFLAMGYASVVDNWLLSLGGTANNGKIVGDRYFLGDHGEYTEVSKSVWQFSYWHSRGRFWLFCLFFATVIGFGILEARRKSAACSEENTESDANASCEAQRSGAGTTR